MLKSLDVAISRFESNDLTGIIDLGIIYLFDCLLLFIMIILLNLTNLIFFLFQPK